MSLVRSCMWCSKASLASCNPCAVGLTNCGGWHRSISIVDSEFEIVTLESAVFWRVVSFAHGRVLWEFWARRWKYRAATADVRCCESKVETPISPPVLGFESGRSARC